MSIHNQSFLHHVQRAQIMNALIIAGAQVHVSLSAEEVRVVRSVDAVADSSVTARFHVTSTLGEEASAETAVLPLGTPLLVFIPAEPVVADLLTQLVDAGAAVQFPLPPHVSDHYVRYGLVCKVEVKQGEGGAVPNVHYLARGEADHEKLWPSAEPLPVYLNVGA